MSMYEKKQTNIASLPSDIMFGGSGVTWPNHTRERKTNQRERLRKKQLDVFLQKSTTYERALGVRMRLGSLAPLALTPRPLSADDANWTHKRKAFLSKASILEIEIRRQILTLI